MAGRWPAQCGPRSSNLGIGISIDDREGQDGDRASIGNVISCCRQVAEILLRSQSNRVTEAAGLLATEVILAHNSVAIRIGSCFCPRQYWMLDVFEKRSKLRTHPFPSDFDPGPIQV